MRTFVRRILLTCGAVYLALSLPLVLLLLRSDYFRVVTASEVTRKLSHVTPMEAVFCGDSITATITDWGRRLGLRPFSTLNLAIPGLYVGQVRDQVRRALALRCRCVIVMAGTNDVADDNHTDDVILADWAAILALAPSDDPRLRIIVSIPFQRDPALDARIDGLNLQLEAAAVRAGWRYVNLNAAFTAARSPRSDLFTDGRHFSELAYGIWTEELARAIRAGR